MAKIIKKMLINFKAILHGLVKKIDKYIIIPITKFFLFVSDFLNKNSKFIERWLTKKNTLIFISLVLSLIIFFLADSKSLMLTETSAEVLYNQSITAIYNKEAYVVEGLPEKIDITLIGRKADLYFAKQLPAHNVTIDLSDLKAGTHKVNLKYKQAISSIDYKLDPSVATVIIYPKLSEMRSLTTDVLNKDNLDPKLFIKSINLSDDNVIIKGAEHQIKKVATVKALVNVNNIISQIAGTTELKDIPLIAYDEKGNTVNVEIVPQKVNATIEIVSPSKEVPIKVIPTGNVAFGKAISAINISETKAIIYGDENVINDIGYIPVNIDVSGLKTGKEYNVTIKKPSGIRYMTVNSATINVSLETQTTKQIDNVYLEYKNLASNLSVQAVTADDNKIPVIMKGVESVLNSIDTSTIKAYVDLSGYDIGTYDVDVLVSGDDVKITYMPKTTTVKLRITNKK